MKRLNYIDEHVISVAAGRADTWLGVVGVLSRNSQDPATVPVGFVVDEVRPPERFALKGRHPFAVYRWVFDLEVDGPRSTRVRSTTWADFPGLRGKIYRALVIGTGAHRAVVRLALRRIAARALAARESIGEDAADYVDIFEVAIQAGDSRTAEELFRDTLVQLPVPLSAVVLGIQRRILRLRLGAFCSSETLIGWRIAHSAGDQLTLEANGPLMHGQLSLHKHDDRRIVLTTRLHYRKRLAGRLVWAMVGPLHRSIARPLMKYAARVEYSITPAS